MKNEEWAAHRIAAIEILHSSLFTLHSSLCNLLAVHYIYAAWQRIDGYSVVWIGVATMLTVVLLTRFMATASDGAVHTLEYFSNSVIWNNFSLIFPATITLIAGCQTTSP